MKYLCSLIKKVSKGQPCILSCIGDEYEGETVFPKSCAINLADGGMDWDKEEANWIAERVFVQWKNTLFAVLGVYVLFCF